MNDGILFLFIIWFWWIVFTFLISKSYNKRFAFSLLFLILLSLQGNYTSSFFITCSVLFVFTSYLMLDEYFLKRIQLIIYGLSATVGYVGIKLIVLFDPVIGIASEKLFISMTLFIIIFSLLPSKTELAIIVLFIAFVNGEWMLRLVLYEMGLSYYRTSYFNLDVLAITFSTLMICTFLFRRLQTGKVQQSHEKIVKKKVDNYYELLRKRAQ